MSRSTHIFVLVVPLIAMCATQLAAPAYACGSVGSAAAGGGEIPPANSDLPSDRVVSFCGSSDLLIRVQPVYPPAAVAANVGGSVDLRVTILPDGTVADVEVISVHPAGYGFENSAIDAVKQWRFRPDSSVGDPPPTRTQRQVVKFVLE